MEMGINQWEWEGMGILIVFLHTSNANRASCQVFEYSINTESTEWCNTNVHIGSSFNGCSTTAVLNE